MTNIVLHLSPEQCREVEAAYIENKVERNAPGVVFSAKLPDVTVTIYRTGKVMFQGAGAEREARRFGGTRQRPGTQTSMVLKGDTLPENFSTLSVIGSDETGTGDYFGPITVAAVFVPKDQIGRITEMGVKDSKQLSDQAVREIAPDIIASCAHSLLILRNEKYNALHSQGYNQGKMKALLHNQAIKHVLEKISPAEPDYILIDQFVERETYYGYLQNEKDVIRENVLFSTKAEQLHVAVAAASIIARYAFLREMDRLSSMVGLPLQKGAGLLVDEMAAKILTRHGEETLRSISKWHFSNTEKAKKICRNMQA
ncbi:ribonuclease HIII [Ureibacillus sp. FSL K6-8385]|uniref:Ribonuclease HIII n=1 Tax=Ureibacillus terrenus TaxID=118246 RepID=A0A540V1M6_9BACL|nr:ribonuclease HIII [Ureibacillus terrenus]MED3661991.1 ribonuclease HIII [Ureibacillus terrenus]MED3764746.1 ribonuclease HIII [Ureibacillus terrenus]TQE90618.1 ribonuclease HIII [Ureibacillus terrenus]